MQLWSTFKVYLQMKCDMFSDCVNCNWEVLRFPPELQLRSVAMFPPDRSHFCFEISTTAFTNRYTLYLSTTSLRGFGSADLFPLRATMQHNTNNYFCNFTQSAPAVWVGSYNSRTSTPLCALFVTPLQKLDARLAYTLKYNDHNSYKMQQAGTARALDFLSANAVARTTAVDGCCAAGDLLLVARAGWTWENRRSHCQGGSRVSAPGTKTHTAHDKPGPISSQYSCWWRNRTGGMPLLSGLPWWAQQRRTAESACVYRGQP